MNAFRWERRGLIQVPVPVEPEPVPVTRLDPVERELASTAWTDETLKRCHAAYNRGLRDVYTIAGNREWERRRQAVRRNPQRMTPEDREWCERQAEKGFWRLYEIVNRRGGNEALQMVAEARIAASMSNKQRVEETTT